MTSSIFLNSLYRHYNDILQGLSAILAKESHARTVDNICSAISKLIIANPNGVPLQQVRKVFFF